MNIVIEDRRKNSRLEERYIATFSTEKSTLKLPYVFPAALNPNDAEEMLLILESIIETPEVYAYFIDIIPQGNLPFVEKYEAKDLIQAFLNGLVSPVKVKILNWDHQNIEYIMGADNLTLSTGDNNFFFPFDSPFINAFIDSYGAYQWHDLDRMQVLTDNEFIEADNFVNDALSPYQSWFVAAEAYDKLCKDIKIVCMKLEILLGQSFFNWNSAIQKESRLISIIKEDAETEV